MRSNADWRVSGSMRGVAPRSQEPRVVRDATVPVYALMSSARSSWLRSYCSISRRSSDANAVAGFESTRWSRVDVGADAGS